MGRLIIWLLLIAFNVFIGGVSVENILNSGWGFFIPFWVAALVGLITAQIAAPLSLALWLLHLTPIHFPLLHHV